MARTTKTDKKEDINSNQPNNSSDAGKTAKSHKPATSPTKAGQGNSETIVEITKPTPALRSAPRIPNSPKLTQKLADTDPKPQQTGRFNKTNVPTTPDQAKLVLKPIPSNVKSKKVHSVNTQAKVHDHHIVHHKQNNNLLLGITLVLIASWLIVQGGMTYLVFNQLQLLQTNQTQQTTSLQKQIDEVRSVAAASKLPSTGTQTGSQPQPPQPVIYNKPNTTDRRLGPADARYIVIEYGDLQCTFCKMLEPGMEQLLKDNPTDLALIFRHYPISQIHPEAKRLANLAECAYQQGKDQTYFGAIQAIYNSSNPGLMQPADIATKLNLDASQLQTCQNSGSNQNRIDSDQQKGFADGVQGTPTLFFYDTKTGKSMASVGYLDYSSLKAKFEQFKQS